MRQRGGEAGAAQRQIKDYKAPSLNLSIYFPHCLTHMARFLRVHTSSVTTKVAPRKGLPRPGARQRRTEQREADVGAARRGGGGDGRVGIVTETPPIFCVLFFSILHFLSLSLPSVKSCLGAFSATKGRGGKKRAWHFHPPIILSIHLPHPLFWIRGVCM